MNPHLAYVLCFGGFFLIVVSMANVTSCNEDPIHSAPLEYNEQELAECACSVAGLGHVEALVPTIACSRDHGLTAPHVQRESRLWNHCRSGTTTARSIHAAERAERLATEVELEADLRRLRLQLEAARAAEDAAR